MLDGVAVRGFEVMRKAQGVSDFMDDHELDQFTDQVVGHRKFLGAFVGGGALGEVPVAGQFHHVVIHPDIRFEDFPGAWIVHVWAERVLRSARDPADH